MGTCINGAACSDMRIAQNLLISNSIQGVVIPNSHAKSGRERDRTSASSGNAVGGNTMLRTYDLLLSTSLQIQTLERSLSYRPSDVSVGMTIERVRVPS